MATREVISKLDELMVSHFHISVEKMMEIAGLQVAELAMKVAKGRKILVLAGHGNNGGDGLVAARYLSNFDYEVDFILAKKELNTECKKQFDKLKGTKANEINTFTEKYDLIIDALLGFNLKGNPFGIYAELIEHANASRIPILSIDLPSGLDADTGNAGDPCIKATHTITLALIKDGLLKNKSVGELYLADIGVPKEMYKMLGVEEQKFPDPIIKII